MTHDLTRNVAHDLAPDTGDRLRVVVVGAPGYTGAELVATLAAHPGAAVVGLFGSDRRGADGKVERMSDLFPRLTGVCDLPVRAADAAAILGCDPDAVFLATPHEASEALAPALLGAGVVVFDLSAAFRLRDASLYPKHYGFEHGHAALLSEAVYGLPEVAGDAGVLVSPLDVDSIARGLAQMLGDPKLRKELAGRALTSAQRFSWDRSAIKTMDVFEEAIEARRARGGRPP